MATTASADRAKRAQLALLFYAQNTGQDLLAESTDVLADLLCDLRHWAEVVGLDFDVESARSASHYEAEQLDDDGEDQSHDDDAPYCDRCGYQHPNDCFESDVPQDTLDAEAEEKEEAGGEASTIGGNW